jgi:stage II sporulation protein D
MKWSTRVVTVLCVAAAACSAPASRSALPSGVPRLPASIRIGVREGNRLTIRKVPFEEYVQATALSELAPPSGDPEVIERMLEIQAVIGRTYALANLGRHAADGYDLCSTTHCQLYEASRLRTSRWAPQAAEAIRQTAGRVLWFDAAPAAAFFHADCGGHTSRADDVWSGSGPPYLISMADDGPAQNAHSSWTYEATRAAMLRALNADPRTRVGVRLDGLQILERDAAGRAERIALHGASERIVRGEELREVLSTAFGARSIRSTWFNVQRRGQAFVFEGRGFGHGVGLCQAGALARLRAGQKLPAILQTYFPGTKIVTLRGISTPALYPAVTPVGRGL